MVAGRPGYSCILVFSHYVSGCAFCCQTWSAGVCVALSCFGVQGFCGRHVVLLLLFWWCFHVYILVFCWLCFCTFVSTYFLTLFHLVVILLLGLFLGRGVFWWRCLFCCWCLSFWGFCAGQVRRGTAGDNPLVTSRSSDAQTCDATQILLLSEQPFAQKVHVRCPKHTFWFCWTDPLAGFTGPIAQNCTETQVSYCHTSSRAPLQRNVHFIIVSSFCFPKVQRFSST